MSDATVFTFLAAAAASSGKVDDEERTLLLNAAQELDLDLGEVAPILEQALLERREPALPDLPPSERQAVLERVCQILLADGAVDRGEQRLLDRLQAVFALDQVAVDRGMTAARKHLSQAERTASGRLARKEERARPVAPDAEVVYSWRGGRVALSAEALFVFRDEEPDRQIPFASIRAVHLEVEEDCCCVSLDVTGEQPVTISEAGSGGGKGHWTYVAFLTHLHERLGRQPNRIAYIAGDSTRFRRARKSLLNDLLLGALLLPFGSWFASGLDPLASNICVGFGAVVLLIFISWHVRSLRSHAVSSYDPAQGLPAQYLPGAHHDLGHSFILTLFFTTD